MTTKGMSADGMFALMREREIASGRLIRSRFAWEGYLARFPAAEDAAAALIASALRVNAAENPMIAFPPELIGAVYDRMDAA